MKHWLILIKREIEDNYGSFGAMLLLTSLYACMLFRFYQKLDPHDQIDGDIVGALTVAFSVVFLTATILGGAQMETDRSAGISAFLATHTPTRKQLLWAKWCAGLLWIGLAMLPVLVVHGFQSLRYEGTGPMMAPLAHLLFWIVIAGYAIGQLIGTVKNKGWGIIVDFSLIPLLLLLVFIKGVSIQTLGFLAVTALAALWLCRFRYLTRAL